jgi:hypothetical protein
LPGAAATFAGPAAGGVSVGVTGIFADMLLVLAGANARRR